MSAPVVSTAVDVRPYWAAQAGRVMRSQARQTWLVPLLAVPLSRVALSPCCTAEVLAACAIERDYDQLHRKAAAVAALAHAVAASEATRGLTDQEALFLLEFTHDAVGLARAALWPAPFLVTGMGLDVGLPAGPLLRAVSAWVASAAVPLPLATFLTAQALKMTRHRPFYLPQMDGHYGPLVRAIDSRLYQQGVITWEGALALAHWYWSGDGWRDLAVWQAHTWEVFEREVHQPACEREQKEDVHHLHQHRAERRRLQDEAVRGQAELRRLRPLRAKVDGLRAEAERLRTREAELVQARDRALARVKAVEAAYAELERECREGRRRLEMPEPVSAEAAEPEPRSVAPPLEADELPAQLLAGRPVYYFTGELRRSTAEDAAESLKALGAEEVRTYCLRQGSDGPDRYPPGALVVVDFRFAGHSQSGPVHDRAARSGAQVVSVRAGKGGLARTVAAALVGQRM